LRNELVEELSIDFISKGRAELDVEDVRESKTSKMESKKSRRGKELRTNRERRA
jgi:hypothetical protein